MKVSYLIPSFNHQAYVLDMLNSILIDLKTLSVEAELVIVDDGSTDDSPQLIEEWYEVNKSEVNVKIYLLDENKGIAATFNKLITYATGDFLRFCGSDDLLLAGSTNLLLQPFLNNDALFCSFGDAAVIDAKGSQIADSSIAYHGGNTLNLADKAAMRSELINHWCLAGPTFLVKKAFYDEVMNYDETLKIDDYDFYLSLLEEKDALIFVNERVSLYRIHASNTSKTKERSRRIDNLTSFLKIIEKHSEKEMLTNELLQVRHLTKAKISFLRHHFVSMIVSLTCYAAAKFRIYRK